MVDRHLTNVPEVNKVWNIGKGRMGSGLVCDRNAITVGKDGSILMVKNTFLLELTTWFNGAPREQEAAAGTRSRQKVD